MKLLQPWPEPYTVNARSPFGWRIDPITGKKKFHHGIDVALPVGTPLVAPADGEVVHKSADWHALPGSAQNKNSGGNVLVMKHGPKDYIVFYHLQKPSHLKVGDKVERGQVVAYSGNTGRSTGPHLHMELRNSRTWGDTRNPVPELVAPGAPEPEPEERPEPVEIPRKPMSAKLARFFDIQRALKVIPRKK